MSHSHTFDEMPDWDAIARYRAGESSADEAAAVSSWFERHPKDAHLLDELDARIAPHLDATPLTQQAIDVEAALQRVHRRLTPDVDAGRQTPRISRTPVRRRRVEWIVGSLAAAAVLGFFIMNKRGSETGVAVDRVATATGLPAGGAFHTEVGVRDSAVLVDGTRVLLAPSSRLLLSPSYGRGSREVTLEGMARFAVQHDSAAPFVVHAGDAVIRDVGTDFVVRSTTSNDKRVSVSVMEGEVTIAPRSSSQPATSLRAGDRAEMQPNGNVAVQRSTASDADTAWTRGVLAYRAAPLEIVREDLRRWFGVELRIADTALSSRRLTATFETKDVEQVLSTIALAVGAEVERSGAVATLRRAANPR